MLVLNSKITIGNLLFDNIVNDVDIKSSRDDFTETATIKLPNNLIKEGKKITDYINVNDEVVIQLGYYPNLNTIFSGYVSKIEPYSPAVVQCENEAFIWKQKTINAYTGRNLKISTLLEGIGFDASYSLGTDPYIGDWAISDNSTLLDILSELKSKFGLLSYWRYDKILYIAEDFGTAGDSVSFDFNKNVIKSSLNYITDAGDIKPIAHGISKQKDNSVVELYAYYDDDNNIVTSTIKPAGVINTMDVAGINKDSLTTLLKRWLPRLRNKGTKGTFTTFGYPRVEHGNDAVMTDNKFPERSGTFKVRSVNTSFGVNGFRQDIEIDQKITTE